MGPGQAFWLNSVVGSPILHYRIRTILLRMSGVQCRNVRVFPGVRWGGSADVTLEDGVIIQSGVLLDACAPIVFKRNSGAGPDAHILTAAHEIGPPDRRFGQIRFEPVTIGVGTWVGARVTVLPGISIGDGCVIAAGAVVTRDCEPNAVYAGVPARRVRELEPEGVEASQ